MLIETRPALDPELAALVAAQQREAWDGGGTGRKAFAPGDDSAYLVAVVDGRAVACAAWCELGDGIAELRRMYVRPSYRGRGIARQLVVAVEEEVLAAGRLLIRLETGPRAAAPLALYRSCGYTPIPAYGEYAGSRHSVCLEKRLAALIQ